LGNDLDSSCVVHNGQSLKTYLHSLPIISDPIPQALNPTISSDQVMSKSLVRNSSSVCASNIINRQFSYSLSSTQSTSTLGWNLTGFISALPNGYSAAVTRVRVTGSTVGGRNVIVDSQTVSSGTGIRIDQYPVTMDVLIRVTSPCGDIDMQSSISIPNPTNTGTFTGNLNGNDLNPRSGEITLTEQLNNLESQVNSLETKTSTMSDPTLGLISQADRISALENQIAEIGSLEVDYVKNGGNKVDELTSVINDLYLMINNLQSQITTQEVEINSLRSQIDSL